MDRLALARALHVVAVVVWIGGLSIVTTALLPAIRRGELGGNWLAAFQAIERRFVWQARIAILLVGGTGLYMIEEADLWDRFSSLAYWWMHAMVGLWAIFTIANTSPPSTRARARARDGGGPWPADKVERWGIDRLIPYAKNARTQRQHFPSVTRACPRVREIKDVLSSEPDQPSPSKLGGQ